MKSIRHLFLVSGIVLAFALFLISFACAQSSEADGLTKRAIELYQEGKYAEAVPLARQALAIYEKTLGPDHPAVAAALNNLASFYDDEGKSAEAEPLLKRALAIDEKALGPEHRKVAITLNNLAELYRKQGHYAEAEPLYRRSLAIREKALGPDDPDVATALDNLGGLYLIQGRYAEAEPLHKRALAIYEDALGSDHPDVATALNNLAMLYRQQGRYAEAEPLYRRALTIDEKALGPDHPDVATALNNLAKLFTEQGQYAEAAPLYSRSLAIYEKALGPNHPDVATALDNLGFLYDYQGRYADAEPLYKRALAIDEKALGLNHPDVATALNNLAMLYRQQGRYAEAEPLYKRALVIDEKVLGSDHPIVATALDNLALLLYDYQDRYAEAELLNKRSLAIYENALGSDHPDVATALNNLAGLYDKHGRYAEAEPLYKRSLAIREKAFGPDHPGVATVLDNLGFIYEHQGRYAEAERLHKRSLAIYENALGSDHPDVATALNNLAGLYNDQGRYVDALPLVRRTLANKTATTLVALPVLFGAQGAKLIAADKAIDESLNVIQRASQTSAGEALNALAVRFSAGNDRLAGLVRKDQDLAGEAVSLDKAIITAVSSEPSKRNAATEQKVRDRINAIAQERDDLDKVFVREFPDYAALSRPEPLTVKDIQAAPLDGKERLLSDDEALVIVALEADKSYVWAITRSSADWKELTVTAQQVSQRVAALRTGLDFHSLKQFDPQASYELYQTILGPVENLLSSKPRLSLVLDGALTSLPPQLLVTGDPTGKALKDVDWLIRTHAVTVLPSIASLKVLRGKSAIAEAPEPLIGFADPIFNPSPQHFAENARSIADVTVTSGIRGTVADLAELKKALPPLPETSIELREVANNVHDAHLANLFIGADATETRVKEEKLDQYRIVYFATHGLVAGDVADFAKLNAEPALVLSLPEHPTDFDDGLLTASEIAQLKLNADWVVLSACNTASAEKPGAEALSGLARAFFYAGARSLVVSNWAVNSESTVALMTNTFAADPKLSHAEALQKSMLAMIGNSQHPQWADPIYWAPFVVVGEPAKPGN
jgi:CHAT domain-containing protein/Tfp pilus assembly protein PilF